MNNAMGSRGTHGAPWYRNVWPWALFGIPGLTIAAGVVTVVLAVRSNDGLVADDYYKRGLTINQTLARENFAAQLGLHGNLTLYDNRIALQLKGREGAQLPQKLLLTWLHPTRAGADHSVALSRVDDAYHGAMMSRLIGRWDLRIEDDARTWRLTAAVRLPSTEPILLGSGELNRQETLRESKP